MEIEYKETKDFIFQDAIAFLKKRHALPKEEYEALDEESKAMAFTVSGYSQLEVLQTFCDTLETAIKEGQTKEQFREQMNDFLSSNGYEEINPWKSETIFRNQIQTAFNAGHYKNMMNPTVKKLRPYWKYVTAGDKDVRESHAAMGEKIYHAEDPIWDIWYPPNGHRCRCMVVSLSQKQMEKNGFKIETEPPYQLNLETGELLPDFPDKGFSNNPAKTAWKADISRFSPELKELLQSKHTDLKSNT